MTREEAITMLYGIQADNLNLDDAFTKDKYDALTMAIKALEEPKTGHWIETNGTILNHRNQILHEVICSECCGIAYFRSIGNEYIGANLCPNCGCRMKSEVVEDA